MNEDTASSTMFEDVVTMIRILSLIPQDRWTTVAEIHQELETAVLRYTAAHFSAT